MSLINCPECSEEVSDSATKCPKCGLQLIKPKRSLFGKLVKFVFICFNIFMPIWLIVGMGAATEGMEAMSGAEQTGAAIGTGIGFMLILTIWVFGDIILGLFMLMTKPKAE